MVYKWYILPIGWLYATYHLLGEPETTIENLLENVLPAAPRNDALWRAYSSNGWQKTHELAKDHTVVSIILLLYVCFVLPQSLWKGSIWQAYQLARCWMFKMCIVYHEGLNVLDSTHSLQWSDEQWKNDSYVHGSLGYLAGFYYLTVYTCYCRYYYQVYQGYLNIH